jgi:serine/threonine-protein kinase HipA
MGALRLVRPSDGVFLDDQPLTVPPVARLRELEHWASEVEQGLPDVDSEEQWIAMLVAPGSSLGGARPKANYREEDGSLWIAKFPSREDRHDLGAWEHVVARLAARGGIDVPESGLRRLGSPYRTYCARRFDRDAGSRRLYASAMTLSGRQDNEDGASYLDIVQAIESFGDPAAIGEDLRQLFRRLVFNVLISNHDDHLRNHGFLRTAAGWRLAPAFDVNPSPHTQEHSLAIDGTLRIPSLGLVRETAGFYRLRAAEAAAIVEQVQTAVVGWRAEATAGGLAREEVERMAIAFERAGDGAADLPKAG